MRKSAVASPSRQRSLLIATGIGFGGFLLYSLFKNTASAAPAEGNPTGSTTGYGGGSNDYTISALDASVPGVSFNQSTLQPGVLTSTLTAVPAVTSSQVASANSLWNSLQAADPPSTGYITFPSGTQVAATLLGSGNTRQDGNGNLYVQWAGQVYQLAGQADSSGNWAATLAGS